MVLGAVILGIVQGLTEFLPVSSSGHLVLMERLLGVHRPGLSLEVALHAGTLAAVLYAYRRDLRAVGLVRPLLWATLPASVAGLALQDAVEALFGSLRAVGAGWAVTAVLLLWAAGRRSGCRRAEELRPAEAVFVGCFQALALAPGVSRSGAVLAAALARGLAPAEAARFAFLLSVPAVAGAALLALPGASANGGEVAGLWLGAAGAAVTGAAAIRWFVGRLERGRLGSFAAYCGALALMAGIHG